MSAKEVAIRGRLCAARGPPSLKKGSYPPESDAACVMDR